MEVFMQVYIILSPGFFQYLVYLNQYINHQDLNQRINHQDLNQRINHQDIKLCRMKI